MNAEGHPLSSVAERKLSRRTALRGAAVVSGTALLGGAVPLIGASSAAAAEEPSLFPREQWGARPPKSPAVLLDTPPDTIVVHHTAFDNSADTSVGHAFQISRDIQDLHMDTNGWDDSGQQLTISRGGHVLEGRNSSLQAIRTGKHCVGAHVAGHNDHSIGIENEGTYVTDTPPEALVDSLVDTLTWLCAAYGLDPRTAILGHRDFNDTLCPGDVLYGMLPGIRDRVSGALTDQGVRVGPRRRADLPRGHRPTYPDVPSHEPERRFYHGPALGPGEHG